jgi:curved DNA-binding protein CbpA
VLGGISVAVAAVGAQYAIKAYNAMPKEKPQEATDGGGGGSVGDAAKEQQPSKGRQTSDQQQQTKAQEGGSSSSVNANMEGIFASWGGSWAEFKKSFFTKGFYDGGFEDKMSKREAALILGVRESTSPDRIKEAHRRVLLLNHPDRGGSAYIAAKINEAKDLLLKGTGTK